MMVPDVFEQFYVERHRISAGRGWLIGKPEVIRMDVDQRHAATPGNPIQFLKPDSRRSLAHHQEEG